MIDLDRRIDALVGFGKALLKFFELSRDGKAGNEVLNRVHAENQWFTPESTLTALKNWSIALSEAEVSKWVGGYKEELGIKKTGRNIGVINAGNIPLVGLHDLLSVLLTGNNYFGKNATGDTILLPFIAKMICEIEPAFTNQINFISKLEKVDAVIATGNNNTSRYFEYYFGKYPHVIRRNRNGAGVLSGNESRELLHALGADIFLYFGLGCRNVSKVYVPRGYDFRSLFESIEDYNMIRQHNKYMNNFDYNSSIFILKRLHFLENGFLIVRNEKQVASPVSVLHFEEYDSIETLENELLNNLDNIQCLVFDKSIRFQNDDIKNLRVDFGSTQTPRLWDYADRVDTIKFLLDLK